jgi:protease-4
VFAGKFVVAKGLNDLGITVDRTGSGPFTGMDSPFHPFSPEQAQKMNSTIDGVYDGFIARVAEGRKLPAGTVAQSAKGRVWTGQQAKQLGLVDELGGLEDAIKLAHDIAGLPANQPSVVHVFPEPLTPFEAIKAAIQGNFDIQGSVHAEMDTALSDLDGPAGAVFRALKQLTGDNSGVRAEMPELGRVK